MLSSMSNGIRIVYQDREICVHDNGVKHSLDLSCSIAELRAWQQHHGEEKPLTQNSSQGDLSEEVPQ